MNAGDYARAMRIFQQWAAKGDSTSMNNIGWMYQHGLGMPVDGEEALKWYSKAAALGNAVAATNAGWIYEHGLGVPVDYAKAMAMYAAGASQRYPLALNHVGFMLQHGLGVPPEPDAAYIYYKMAAAAGSEEAPVHIQELIASGTLDKRTIAAPKQPDPPTTLARSRPEPLDPAEP
jgi:TPR repeat protein